MSTVKLFNSRSTTNVFSDIVQFYEILSNSSERVVEFKIPSWIGEVFFSLLLGALMYLFFDFWSRHLHPERQADMMDQHLTGWGLPIFSRR